MMYRSTYDKKVVWIRLIISSFFILFNMLLFIRTYFAWVNGEMAMSAWVLFILNAMMTSLYVWLFYTSVSSILKVHKIRKQFDEADRCRERLKIMRTPDTVLPCKECKNRNYCWNRYRIY